MIVWLCFFSLIVSKNFQKNIKNDFCIVRVVEFKKDHLNIRFIRTSINRLLSDLLLELAINVTSSKLNSFVR